jgi:sorting nexin-13
LRDSIWGDSAGAFSEQNLQLDSLKTRFLARSLMLSAVPDELRLFIGASTIHTGVENISEVLQNRHLNRRFWYVVFERLLRTIFPNNRFDRLIPQLHAKSPRTQMA